MIELSDSHKTNFDCILKLEKSFENVKFFKKNHQYEIDGVPASMSVSQLISRYDKPFEREKMADRVAKRDSVLIEDVLKQWDWNKEYSCYKGSEFHSIVENFFNRKFLQIDRKSFLLFLKEHNIEDQEKYTMSYYDEMTVFIKNFKNFYDWWKEDHILIKSEFVVGDSETKICGTIDNLSYNTKTKKLAIFDYKTNKEIKREGFRGETLLPPLNHIQKCEYEKYNLQLQFYKFILERNTDFEVGDCYIVWVASQNDYELIPTYDVTKECLSILKSQKII